MKDSNFLIMKKKWYKQRVSEDNVIAVVKNLLYYLNVPFTNISLEKEILYHHKYPSLQTISDVLTIYHIPNKAVLITEEKLFNIQYPAIAYFNEEKKFVILHSIKEDMITYIDPEKGWKTVNIDIFQAKWKGFILMVLKVEKSSEINLENNRKEEKEEQKQNIFISFLSLIIIFYFFLNSFSNINLIFPVLITNILKLIGFFTSTVLFKMEIGRTGTWASNFCQLHKSFNCNISLSKVFGNFFKKDFSLAEIGIIYFSSSLILLNLLTYIQQAITFFEIQLFISFVSATLAVFLILVQVLYLKKICPFCLIVNTILISELFITIKNLDVFINPEWKIIISLGSFSLLLSITMFNLLKNIIKKNLKNKSFEQKYILILSKSDFFKNIIETHPKINYNDFEYDILIGNKDSSDEILLILSPFCSYCHEILLEAQRIFEISANIKIRIRFVFENNTESLDYKVIEIILSKLLSDGVNTAYELLHDWYKNKESSRKNKLNWINNNLNNNEKLNIEKLIKEHLNFYKNIGIDRTPFIVYNGYFLSEKIEFSFLRNYILYGRNEIKNI